MSEQNKTDEFENMSFEDAIKELEGIVEELEGNEISLDDAVSAYEKGAKLKNICQGETIPNLISISIKFLLIAKSLNQFKT